MKIDAPLSPLPRRTAGVAGWRAEALPIAVLAGITLVIVWNRLVFDSWLARLDIYTFYLPWFHELGARLRQAEVPAWNPHLFSGTPFAGDPQSDWMYLPAMAAFALLPALAAFKAMVAAQLAIAALSTYALARVLRLGAWAAVVAAVAFVCGPLLQWNTYCCLVMGQFATWTPAALLGLELAFRSITWRRRLLSWALAGFAISQLLAAWVGEGWFDALLILGGYALFRLLVPAREPAGATLMRRVLPVVISTGASVLLGFALGAAGILPRLAVNRESNLADGNYAGLGNAGADNPPWSPSALFTHLLRTGYDDRMLALGGAIAVLALLGLVLGSRTGATPFFAVLTVVSLVLPLDTTPLHRLLYLIPHLQTMHEHDPWRSVALGALGPPMLAAAAVEGLASRTIAWRRAVVVWPMAALIAGAWLLDAISGVFIGWGVLLAGAAATAIVFCAALAGARARPWLAPALLIVVALAQPVGLEWLGSWFDWPHDRGWESHWRPAPVVATTLASEIAPTDDGGAGAFLQARLAAEGPFRYLGYGGIDLSGYQPGSGNYMSRRFQPTVHALLVNGRAMFLGLDDVQGYNPIELARYSAFIAAVNGAPQNYHLADLLPSGATSPLLDLLDVRYVVVPLNLPGARADVAALTNGGSEVYRDRLVAVYRREPSADHAWIVHDVRSVETGQALATLTAGGIDPHTAAVVEGTTAATAAPDDAARESAQVTSDAPEAIALSVHAEAAGLLVVSEIAASGWSATVDGTSTPILVTDGVLRRIPVTAGDHVVEMRYRPRSLAIGLGITAGATSAMVCVLAGAAWFSWRERRRRRRRFGAPALSPEPGQRQLKYSRWMCVRSTPARRSAAWKCCSIPCGPHM